MDQVGVAHGFAVGYTIGAGKLGGALVARSGSRDLRSDQWGARPDELG